MRVHLKYTPQPAATCGLRSLPQETECETCGSEYHVARERRSNRLLCKRCLYWQSFQDLVNQGDENAAIISWQLDCCYPNNVDKQKDLFIAVIEALDEVESDQAVGEETLVHLAAKWRVEPVIYEEILKAVSEGSSVLLKKAANRSTIPKEDTMQTD